MYAYTCANPRPAKLIRIGKSGSGILKFKF